MGLISFLDSIILGLSWVLAISLATFMALLPLLAVVSVVGMLVSSKTFWRLLASLGSPYAAYVLATMLEQSQAEAAQAEAIAWYRRANECSYPIAALRLGFLLLNGPLECRDYDEAEWCFRRAWELGYAQALTGLATIYEYGKTGHRDQAYAFHLSRTAVAMGFVDAHNNVGYYYSNGGPVDIDRQKAFEHILVAAKAGNSEAQANVAKFFETGDGVAQDHMEAVKWLRRAARKGSPEARIDLWKRSRLKMVLRFLTVWLQVRIFNRPGDRVTLAYCYLTGYGVRRNERLALEYFQSAAEAGERSSFEQLGNYHETHCQWDQAFKVYEQGAKLGSLHSMLALARLYQAKQAGRRDPARAIEFLSMASDLGEADARVWEADVYLDETWEGRDTAKGMSMLRAAAEGGSALAQSKLGYRLLEGQGTERDVAEAVKWLAAAAEQGQAAAQHNLAECYEMGTGVEADPAQAYFWYKAAHFELAVSGPPLWRVQDQLPQAVIQSINVRLLEWFEARGYRFDSEAMQGYLKIAF